jgi:putative peptide zinc metalloprotease protein
MAGSWKSRLVVKAPMDGVVMDLAPELRRALGPSHHALAWWDGAAAVARGYVDGDELGRIAQGYEGRFVDEQRQMPPVKLHLSRIAAAASDTLDNWLLASIHGGPVASRADEKAARSEHAVFEVAAEVEPPTGPLPLTELRGEIEVRGSAESLALRVFRRIARS